MRLGVAGALIALMLVSQGAAAQQTQQPQDTIGWLKTSNGDVAIVRAGSRLPGSVGMALRRGDVIETGADGSAGVTLADNSLLSAGPRTQLSLDEFTYDSSQLKGSSLANLRYGTLSASSGDIARGTPGAMRIGTPTAMLAVRGTNFLVRVAQ